MGILTLLLLSPHSLMGILTLLSHIYAMICHFLRHKEPEKVSISSILCNHRFDVVSNVYQYGTRQASKGDIFLSQKNTLKYGIRSVQYYGAKCWNDIPDYITRSPSIKSFQQNLRSLLFERDY